MGRGTSKSGGGGGGNQTNQMPQIPSGANIPTNAQAMDDATADQIRQLEDSMYSASTTAAIKMYISNTDFDNQGHSLSQTMNYLIDNDVDFANADLNQINRQFGLRLSSSDLLSMQYTQSRMNQAFHTIGQDTVLQRGAHDDLLRNTFGISDYTKMTDTQLKSALVGQAFRNKAPMSTSYDMSRNPFLGSGSGVSGGREVVFNIKAGANTPMLFGAKKQSEIILGSTNWKITDVKYTGKTATPRGGNYKPQIQIDIETF